ncbi:WD40 repeat-like protein [Stereum hirsutum FP-91666 SS1]|uniref:WD40 repeat-like protein n=1 Tax=Stereum hirsutum (strain FP-91666) TaxID=721885 RepID=UPI000440C128|nr:WD40 repeat-like protein [Stereum hirsutum FP-91666 SS1]EIM89586.1 WD40 repeat-like protein [Stereum hirsutum FP-91666 SS1]
MLAGLIQILEPHNSKSTHSNETGRLIDQVDEKFSVAIKAQGEEIGRLLDDGVTGLVIEADNDVQTIAQALGHLSELLDVLTSNVAMDGTHVLERLHIGIGQHNDGASPSPSAPSANPYLQLLPSDVRPHSGSESRNIPARPKALDEGLSALKAILSTVKEFSDAFPPLKTATSGLLAVLELIDKVHGAKEELEDAADMLNLVLKIVKDHRSKSLGSHEKLSSPDHRIDQISATIETQDAEIRRLLQRGITKRIIDAESDVQTIARALRTISNTIDVLTLDVVMNNRRVLESIQSGVEGLADDADFSKYQGIPNVDACLPGTRVEILQDLLAWARSRDASHVLWLSGGAGTGKSTIAASIVRLLHRHDLLGGHFFCSRDQKREDVKSIIPSLAGYLASVRPAYAQERRNSAKAELVLDIRDQFMTLLSEPIKAALNGVSAPMLIFVVDALDECSDTKATQNILRLLLQHAPNLPVKFLVTSRPERHIRNTLSIEYPKTLRLQDVDENSIHKDIELYLRTELSALAAHNDLERGSLVEWPSDTQVQILTRHADGLFIFASTALKYISDNDPQGRLHELTDPALPSSPFAIRPIDNMYTFILERALSVLNTSPKSSERSDFLRCLSAVICVAETLSVHSMANLLRINPRRVRVAVGNIHSLVSVPRDERGFLTTYHASFGDYLTDRERSGRHPWFVNVVETHLDLAHGCLDIMSSQLYFDVARVQTSSAPNTHQTLRAIPDDVSYACRFWNEHAIASEQGYDSKLWPCLESVLKSKFLYWVEVLSALGLVAGSPARIQKLILRVKVSSIFIMQFETDARAFLMDFNEPISRCLAHIYISALPFSPSHSQITQLYRKHFPNTLLCCAELLESRKRKHMILHIPNPVLSVAFSPDGTKIVSGSIEHTLRMWDVESGEEVSKPFEGHTDSICSVAFSPDGTKIVSGSTDRTIRVWDVESGKEVSKPFEGHIDNVWSVAFSPDGTKIVSGSSDRTIRMWDVESGEEVSKPFKGHTESVSSVAFSPDGTKIVSGSFDQTIRMWDVENGEEVLKPFKGHTDSICSVAFSPDGTKIVSGSYDHTIRVWDVESGKEVLKPFEGHTDSICSVAFWPDGTKIVSGSSDRTIRMWDVESGEEVSKPFEGHTSIVNSVTFSPDGTKIVSGSSDCTVRVWDVESGKEVLKPFEGHTESVRSVAFSPDGTNIVSGSYDHTIRVWDVESGKEVSKPFNGHTSIVNSVAFSPDGTKIASGSFDRTIRVWDVESGKEVSKPFEGPTNYVTTSAFLPDGMKVVSGSKDGGIEAQGSSSKVCLCFRWPCVLLMHFSNIFINSSDVYIYRLQTRVI